MRHFRELTAEEISTEPQDDHGERLLLCAIIKKATTDLPLRSPHRFQKDSDWHERLREFDASVRFLYAGTDVSVFPWIMDLLDLEPAAIREHCTKQMRAQVRDKQAHHGFRARIARARREFGLW